MATTAAGDPSPRLRGPALLSVPDAARALAIGRSKLYELIGDGQLGTVRIGRRRLVPAHEIARFVARLSMDGE
jgi:excisionase family DNA binding protein